MTLEWTLPQYGMETQDAASDWLVDLLKPQLHFFLDGTRGNGILETQECNSTEVEITHSPVRMSEYYFLRILQELHSQVGIRTSPHWQHIEYTNNSYK